MTCRFYLGGGQLDIEEDKPGLRQEHKVLGAGLCEIKSNFMAWVNGSGNFQGRLEPLAVHS